jgi:hypothetical protein
VSTHGQVVADPLRRRRMHAGDIAHLTLIDEAFLPEAKALGVVLLAAVVVLLAVPLVSLLPSWQGPALWMFLVGAGAGRAACREGDRSAACWPARGWSASQPRGMTSGSDVQGGAQWYS